VTILLAAWRLSRPLAAPVTGILMSACLGGLTLAAAAVSSSVATSIMIYPMTSVARRLGVKPGTAKSYLDRVRDKYDQVGRSARTKIELRDRAVEDGILPSDPADP
jgi:hypothetical protein